MRWLWILTLVCGCSFFEEDNRSGHHGGSDIDVDAAIQLCPTMVFTGQSCSTSCVWGESAPDAGALDHVCTCEPDHRYVCVDHRITCPLSDPSSYSCSPGDGPCSYGQTTCSCMLGQWRCNSCPADFKSPGATCTPGRTCDYEDWEHGCSCTCDDQGYWNCFNETIGSSCPHHDVYDAGV